MAEAAAHMTQNPLSELLTNLGLDRTDLQRLDESEVTLMGLMTEHLKPVAWKKELERRDYMRGMWECHLERCAEAEAEGKPEPTWYCGEGPDEELNEEASLNALGCEIDGGCLAHSELHMAKAYDLGIKDELPEWMTWELLEDWLTQLKTKAFARETPAPNHTHTPPPLA